MMTKIGEYIYSSRGNPTNKDVLLCKISKCTPSCVANIGPQHFYQNLR